MIPPRPRDAGSAPKPRGVVHVVVAGEVGGAERMLVDLVAEPTEGGRPHSVALLTPSDRLRALFASAGVSVDDRGRVDEGPLTTLAHAFAEEPVAWLTHVLARRDAAIVHLHTFGSQVLGARAAIRHGAAIVRTEHSTRVYDDPTCWPLSRWSLARADRVVAISEHIAGVVRRRAPWASGRLTIVPNGVVVDRFNPVAAASNVSGPPASRRRPAPLRLVAVGRLDRRKGLDVALRALALAPFATLDVVGDGDERAALQHLAVELGVTDRVRFVGYQGDVREAIASADAALSSARSEGLGIALLEAMASGRPVIASPTGGVPEIVRDGDTGWLAPSSGALPLARAMLDAHERPDERARRGEHARAFVSARYSVEAMRRGYEAVYASVIA